MNPYIDRKCFNRKSYYQITDLDFIKFCSVPLNISNNIDKVLGNVSPSKIRLPNLLSFDDEIRINRPIKKKSKWFTKKSKEDWKLKYVGIYTMWLYMDATAIVLWEQV